jgi:uncharacterized SAM-binding protein YcdF (DUF218 family)
MFRYVRLLLILGLVYVGMFAVFVTALPPPFGVPPQGLDGLAVFTGGSGRVDTAVDLMKQGFAGPVFISGVHEDVKLSSLTNVAKLTPAQRAAITLDYASRTTRENVLNTAYWAEKHHLRRLGIITSTYHAMRCEVLFRLLAPETGIVLLPVQPVDGRGITLFKEFNKLLLAPLLP